jgi:putative hydrolase of the HAD superfamily
MQRYFLNFTAIAFDLDDTLFDREIAVRSLMLAWLGELAPSTMGEILLRDGCGHTPRDPFFAWLEETFPQLGKGRWQQFRAELSTHVVADPAARPLLELLIASGLTLGLLTNGGTVHQMTKLQATGLAGFFPLEQILVSESIGWEKPHPMAFTALAAACGVPPQRILFIGDHPTMDIAGAKNSGLQTCWLRRRDPAGICAEADLVVDSLTEIIPLLFHPA